MFRDVTEKDLAAVARIALRMQATDSLEELSAILLEASVDLIACEHATFNEIDPFFARTTSSSTDAGLDAYLDHDKLVIWQQLLHTHPLLQHFLGRPSDQPRQLADITSMRHFYQDALYDEIYRDSDTDHQLVLYLGNDPSAGDRHGTMPLSLGVAVNRKTAAFSARDTQALLLLQRLCRPIYRAKRAMHYMKLIQTAQFTPALQRCLMGFGLTERQAEVCFWMLQGKSNNEIGVILDVGAQTIRQHSIKIFERLDASGRMAMQQAVILGILQES